MQYEAQCAKGQSVAHVLYGSGGELTADGNQYWYQGAAALEGQAEEADRFGYTLAAIRTPLRQIYCR